MGVLIAPIVEVTTISGGTMVQLKRSTLLALLGIETTDGVATTDQIKHGYRKLSLAVHPDTGGTDLQFRAAGELRDWLIEHATAKPAPAPEPTMIDIFADWDRMSRDWAERVFKQREAEERIRKQAEQMAAENDAKNKRKAEETYLKYAVMINQDPGRLRHRERILVYVNFLAKSKTYIFSQTDRYFSDVFVIPMDGNKPYHRVLTAAPQNQELIDLFNMDVITTLLDEVLNNGSNNLYQTYKHTENISSYAVRLADKPLTYWDMFKAYVTFNKPMRKACKQYLHM